MTNRIDFWGFDLPSPGRTNHKHREEAQEILNQTSAGDWASLEQQFGTRFIELMSLPYFDLIQFLLICKIVEELLSKRTILNFRKRKRKFLCCVHQLRKAGV